MKHIIILVIVLTTIISAVKFMPPMDNTDKLTIRAHQSRTNFIKYEIKANSTNFKWLSTVYQTIADQQQTLSEESVAEIQSILLSDK